VRSTGEIILDICAIDAELNEMLSHSLKWLHVNGRVSDAYDDLRDELGRLKEKYLTELGHAYFNETAP
jgi:hypothetical protein